MISVRKDQKTRGMDIFKPVPMGTLGGTVCSFGVSLSLHDMLSTMVLTVIGSTISFLLSKLLNQRFRK